LDAKEQETIRQYLLGQLPQEDSARLEERLLMDGGFYDELLIAEDELIDLYLRDKLSPTERQSFETHFLSAPERKQKLRFARALHKYVGLAAESIEEQKPEDALTETRRVVKLSPTKNFFWFLPFTNRTVSYSFAAAILLVIGGVSWLVFNSWRQSPPVQGGNVLTVVLTPGVTRDSGSTQSIRIPPGTATVQLRLALGASQYQSYLAELLTSERVSILVRRDLKPETQGSEKFITLTVPSAILKRDDYQVKLSTQLPDGSYEDTDRYSFRVVK
jgi:anti-sigma factor RsiW